jgi:hypothetical protein
MKNFKWITGISILLFLVASAMPAYSAKPWPQGGDKGPKIPEGFNALDDGTTCTDGATPAQNLFDAAEGHIDALGYSARKRDLKEGNTYPMPITSELEEETPYKDQAAMAWDTYHALADFNKGKDVSGKIGSVVNKFLSNVSFMDVDGVITILDGGRITGDDLQGAYDDLADLRDCVTP